MDGRSDGTGESRRPSTMLARNFSVARSEVFDSPSTTVAKAPKAYMSLVNAVDVADSPASSSGAIESGERRSFVDVRNCAVTSATGWANARPASLHPLSSTPTKMHSALRLQCAIEHCAVQESEHQSQNTEDSLVANTHWKEGVGTAQRHQPDRGERRCLWRLRTARGTAHRHHNLQAPPGARVGCSPSPPAISPFAHLASSSNNLCAARTQVGRHNANRPARAIRRVRDDS